MSAKRKGAFYVGREYRTSPLSQGKGKFSVFVIRRTFPFFLEYDSIVAPKRYIEKIMSEDTDIKEAWFKYNKK